MTSIGRRWRVVLIPAVATVVATSLEAQARGTEPTVLLQAAVHQETVNGNLDSAITLYRRVVDDRRADRGSVARALVGLGRAYEMRGQTDAVRTYQRVVNEFGDQSEHAATARQRLAALQSRVVQSGAAAATVAGSRTGEGVYSMVFADLPALRPGDASHYDYAPAGDQMVMTMPADPADSTLGNSLVVVNSGGAVVRTLVPNRREVGMRFPRWSPDGKHIVYREGAWVGADTSFAAIKIIAVEGGQPRTLSTQHAPFGGARGGIFWTPDSKAITVALPSQQGRLVTLDLNGNVLRTIPFDVGHLTQVVGYSPDGRWLAYHRLRQGTEQGQMDVWIMPAEGGQAIRVTQSARWDAWPAWAADGTSLFFVSNRTGSDNVWQVRIDPRSGAPGEAVQITSYTDVMIRHPKVLESGRLAFTLIRQTATVRVASTARPEATRAIARGRKPWISPDGRTVYYLGQGTTPPGIFAASTDSVATPRRLTTTRPPEVAFQTFTVSHDGRYLSYFSQEGSQNVLRTVETATGVAREIARLDSREHLVPAWSPDGSRLAYTHRNGLFVIAAQGGEPRKIAEVRSWEGWTVRWSPDGQHISALAYVSAPDSMNTAVVVPASGGQLRLLTPREETGYKEILEWHPDGKRLTYMYYGHDDRADETRFAYLDGRPTSKMLDQPYPIWDYVGAWHPAGRDFYFIASTSGSWSLYAHDERSGSARVIWHHKGASPGASYPTFSRDGNVMAFETGTTTRQLWVIDGLSSPR